MTRRSRESDDEYVPSDIERQFINTIWRNKRQKKGKLPSYDYIQGENLVNGKLPSYYEVIKEEEDCLKKQEQIIFDSWKKINEYIDEAFKNRLFWINEWEKYQKRLEDFKKISSYYIKGWGQKKK